MKSLVKNNKGSIAFVIIISLVSLMTIVFLSNLLVLDKVVSKRFDKRFENELYRNQNIIEITKNVTLQRLQTKETPYQNKSLYALDPKDVTDIQNAINNSILPNFMQGYTITLTNTKNGETLNTLCQENIEIDPITDEEEVHGVECDATYFDISYEIAIGGVNGGQNIKLIFNNLFAKESESGYIQTETSNVSIHTISL